MKCPKCSYISFDYNASCPKCNKDVTSEARKLNLPSYKPSPPALLGSLSGDTNDSYANLLRNTYSGPAPEEPNLDVGLNDSSEIGGQEGVFDDGRDLDINFGSGEFDASGASGEFDASGASGEFDAGGASGEFDVGGSAESESVEEEDENVYSLDDLKLDETGQLSVGGGSKPSEET